MCGGARVSYIIEAHSCDSEPQIRNCKNGQKVVEFCKTMSKICQNMFPECSQGSSRFFCATREMQLKSTAVFMHHSHHRVISHSVSQVFPMQKRVWPIVFPKSFQCWTSFHRPSCAHAKASFPHASSYPTCSHHTVRHRVCHIMRNVQTLQLCSHSFVRLCAPRRWEDGALAWLCFFFFLRHLPPCTSHSAWYVSRGAGQYNSLPPGTLNSAVQKGSRCHLHQPALPRTRHRRYPIPKSEASSSSSSDRISAKSNSHRNMLSDRLGLIFQHEQKGGSVSLPCIVRFPQVFAAVLRRLVHVNGQQQPIVQARSLALRIA